MVAGIQGTPHPRYVARRTRRGLVVEHCDGPDPTLSGVPGKGLREGSRIDARAPVALDRLHDETETPGPPPPQSRAKWPVSYTSTRSPGDRCVDERRLPRPGSGGGEDEDPALGAKDAAHRLEAREPEVRELRPAVVDGGPGRWPRAPARARWSAPESAGSGALGGCARVLLKRSEQPSNDRRGRMPFHPPGESTPPAGVFPAAARLAWEGPLPLPSRMTSATRPGGFRCRRPAALARLPRPRGADAPALRPPAGGSPAGCGPGIPCGSGRAAGAPERRGPRTPRSPPESGWRKA